MFFYRKHKVIPFDFELYFLDACIEKKKKIKKEDIDIFVYVVTYDLNFLIFK